MAISVILLFIVGCVGVWPRARGTHTAQHTFTTLNRSIKLEEKRVRERVSQTV